MRKKQENIDEEVEKDLRFACSLNPPKSQPTDHSHTLRLHPRDCSVIQVRTKLVSEHCVARDVTRQRRAVGQREEGPYRRDRQKG